MLGQLLVVVWDYLSHVSTTRTDPWSYCKCRSYAAGGIGPGISGKGHACPPADRSHLGLSIQLVLCCVLIDSVQSLRARKEFMARNGSDSIRVLVNHWRWLEANGYKQQAASCKRQAASLTRRQYRIIKDICKQRKLYKL